jgi:NTE family protein
MKMSATLKIGYALGGGAARGLSHIGVLKVFEENNIHPDVIVGTSIGAIIGALYAGGHSAKEIEQIALGLGWKKMVSLADISIPAGGLVQGKRIVALLESILGHLSFSQLKIPYACATTDVVTGEEVIMQEGSLIDAIRASISLPGIFKPVHHQGRFLVDGGLVNEVPVIVCRQLGANYVIGVNVIPPPGRVMNKSRHSSNPIEEYCEPSEKSSGTHPAPKKHLERIEKALNDFISHHGKQHKTCIDQSSESIIRLKPPTLREVFRQSLIIAQYHIAVENMKSADLAINPNIADIGFWQFNRAADAIKAGEEAAIEALKQSDLLKVKY